MWHDVREVIAQAFARLGRVLATDLPGLVAMVIVLAGTVVLALLVRWALRALLERVAFDRRARAWGLLGEPGEPQGRPASRVIAAGSFWLVVAAGVALALEVLGSSGSAVGLSLLGLLPRIVVGIVILLVGVGVARLVERNVLIGGVNLRFRHARMMASGVKWVVVALAAAMALQHAEIGGNLPAIAFAVVAGAIALAGALAFGLGARDAVTRAIDKLGRPEGEGGRTESSDRIQHL
jgi:hypothetical protein